MSKLFWLISCLMAVGFYAELCETSSADRIEGAALKIATFNVQIFGSKKMANTLVREILVKVILRYDIILIQEIRSKRDRPINLLFADVNRVSSPPGVYKMALSVRLGRTASKEQYAFLYRSDKVTVTDSYLYHDNQDTFQREPFVVRFQAKGAYVSDFAMAAIHTSPKAAELEIDHLVDVYDDIVQRWQLRDVMILGDYNAGCSYVTRSEWRKIRLATDKRFYWLFSDLMDTTVAKSDCPYDRMVVAGYNMTRGIFPDSAYVFNYKDAYGLSQDEAEKVSDHWPIEIQFKDSTYRDEEQFFQESVTVTIRDKRISKVSEDQLFLMSSENPLLSQGFTAKTTYNKRGMENIIISKETVSVGEASDAVKTFRETYPKLVSSSQEAVSKRKIGQLTQVGDADCVARQHETTVYQMLSNTCHDVKVKEIYSVQLVCNVPLGLCEINVEAAN